MKTNRTLLLLFIVFAVFQTAFAQGNTPVAVVMKADGPVMPPMLEYIKRGIETANRRNAEVVVIELNTPGGNIETMLEIISEIRSSNVPVVVYVTPRNAIAGSAGAMITLSGHASAMAPETSIGASSPISSSGENLSSTADKKAKEIIKASIRPYVTPRGDEALKLAESMIDDAKAVTADEALAVNLIDFISKDVNELLQSLDGFTVQMDDGPRTLHTKDIKVQSLNISFIEQLLILMTNPNISFLLLAIGVQAILIELASPGGWVAGFIGVVCLTLSIYGLGLLSVNLFGIIFLVTAFVLFVLDIKAPTHGALTTAGVASFIVGGLVLFNSPGTPDFQRVSVPLVVGTGIFIGLLFFGIMMIALRSLHNPAWMGGESYVGKIGTVKSFEGNIGQVQVGSELWTAEKDAASGNIGKGDKIEVVEIRGLRLIVRKK